MKVGQRISGVGKLMAILAATFVTSIAFSQDKVADNMLIYQRAVGGWPKQIDGKKLDYNKPLSEQEKKAAIADSLHKDATIDNFATVKEIRYLSKAYKTTGNKAYLNAVNKGIAYLLKAQNKAGGWPQYYPDSSLYRSEITFNDNAMVNVLNVLMDVTKGINDMEIVDPSFKLKAAQAIEKGVQCILATQIKVNGKLTVWCAQYDAKTLQPATARKYELPSFSGAESVGIVGFLMRIEPTTPAIRNSLAAAADWFQKSKIAGFRYEDVPDASLPKGYDRVLVPDANAAVWARFYDIDTNKPFFSGRDGIKRFDVKEIEYERRAGYAWYGNWPQKFLEKEYPAWLKKHQ